MSMAMALEYITEYCRDTFGWKVNECGVQYDAQPAMDAGQFYVAFDDAGVEGGSDNTDSLKETLNITIGIWRRPSYLMKDKRGQLKLPHDLYILGAYTLNDLERMLIVHNSANSEKKGLHNNYGFLSNLNTRYNLPNSEYGASFLTPLNYRGRGRMESIATESGAGTDVQAWLGYRLRLRGLMREQKLRTINDATG